MRFSVLIVRKIREGRVCSDDHCVRETGAEAEADDEDVEKDGIGKADGENFRRCPEHLSRDLSTGGKGCLGKWDVEVFGRSASRSVVKIQKI